MVPNLKGFAAANGHLGKSDDEVRVELGDKFPKHIYHSIICIGAQVAHREDGAHNARSTAVADPCVAIFTDAAALGMCGFASVL
jgi:hypothetical protein